VQYASLFRGMLSYRLAAREIVSITPLLIAVLGFAVGSAGAQTVDDYLKQIHDPDPVKRGEAAGSLRTFSPSDTVVSALIQLLKDDSAGVRFRAANSIGHFGRMQSARFPH
jgi:HEAT repeat protein